MFHCILYFFFILFYFFFFFQAEDGIRDWSVTGVQTCALPIFGTTALYSFRSKLLDVMVADQDRLLQRVADSQEQKLLSLQKALIQSASEIRDADIASSDAAQRYLDTNTGLYAGFDRSTFLFSDKGILLAERPYRP